MDPPANFPMITTNIIGEVADGYLFISNTVEPNIAYHYIVDNNGDIIYYGLGNFVDFKKVSDTTLNYFDRDKLKHFLVDEEYAPIDSFACGNNKDTDFHDIFFRENGNPILICTDENLWDTVFIGGDTLLNMTVRGDYAQEIDKDSKEVLFEWDVWNHYSPNDNRHEIGGPTTNVDYVHGNSVWEMSDGSLLFSSKRMDEITKINMNDSSIIWRLGGNSNDFTFVNDTGFCSQHAAQELPNGNILLFDNAKFTGVPRGVIYEIDTTLFTATLVQEFTNPLVSYSPNRGNVQMLENNNVLICWGGVSTNSPNVS